MGSQILFLEKSKVDLDNVNATLTVTDAVASDTGQSIIDFVRNRNNSSSWLTTGSTDAADTEILIELGDTTNITDIILIDHNWKAYTIQYHNGTIFTDFSVAINETVNTSTGTSYNFSSVSTTQLKIIIDSTQIVDADKRLGQLIITDRIGQLNAWPKINRPMVSLNKVKTKMLSGKTHVAETTGFFACELDVKILKLDADLTLLESIYFSREGSLVWINAGDDAQFSSLRVGYRFRDIFLMRPIDEWNPEWHESIYTSGMKIKVKLQESVN